MTRSLASATPGWMATAATSNTAAEILVTVMRFGMSNRRTRAKSVREWRLRRCSVQRTASIAGLAERAISSVRNLHRVPIRPGERAEIERRRFVLDQVLEL